MTEERLLGTLAWRHPAAPLAWLVLPLPLWWVLGAANLAWFAAAAVMVVAMLRRGRNPLPPAFGWWALFLLWLVLSATMLGLDPAGTVPEPASARVVPVVFRALEYGSATVVLLWVHGLDQRRVPTSLLVRLLGVLLVWTVCGGLLGAWWPGFELTSPVELALPAGLASVAYVNALVHPVAVQVEDFLNLGTGRPAAPFPYTNSWGNALGLLLPWGVVAAASARSWAARLRWAWVLPVAAVPAVVSLNRGLWVGLVVGVVTTAGLLVAAHRLDAVGALAAACAAVVVVLAVSPLGSLAQARQSGTAPSDDIRAHSTARALELAVDSPVLGYGSTRAEQGSPQTIAVGKSVACHNCGNLPIGTNGQLWFVLVGQGFVGAAFYLAYHLALLRALARRRTLVAGAGVVTVVLTIWFSAVYDRIGPTGCIEMLALGVAGRHLLRAPSASSDDRSGDVEVAPVPVRAVVPSSRGTA